MKIKKIILSMVSTLILAIVFMSQSVFAVETGSWKFTELNADNNNPYKSAINESNPEFGLDYDGNTVNLVVTQIGNQSGERQLNFYCAMADVGFENRTSWTGNTSKYEDTYTSKYNMNKEQSAVQGVGMYTDNTKYKQILALADLFYLGDSDAELEQYLKPLVDNQKLYYDDYTYEQLKNNNALITPNQIRAVQQLALWYFTNEGIDYTSLDEYNDAVAFLYYRATGIYTSLAGTNQINNIQNNQAKQLYKYLINTAKTNAANSNYKYLNTVNLYLDNTTDDEQPIIEIVPGKKELDLALRKYITKVGSTDVTNRVPNIDKTNLDNGTKTTAEYKHRKDPVTVQEGQNVTYTLTVYNEGEIKGKATEIVDQLPTGVVFDKDATESIEENSNYTFTYDSILNIVTIKDKRANTEGLLNEYEGILDSASVQVVCTVIAEPDTDNEKIFTNVAWISKAYNASTAQEYTQADIDRDSAPGTYPNVNKDDMENYKGKNTNKDVIPEDSNYHYEGEQDDDDFEKIVLKPQKFDLALRKFITKIADKNITNRIPQITGNTVIEEDTTAEKTHPKDKLEVVKGDTVVYTIRVYNEGYKDGYASEVTDYLPEGLTLKENSAINTKYGWTASGKTIKTTYLSDRLLIAVNRDYAKFNGNDAENKYYTDLQVECIVNNNATSNNLKNIAEITVAKDRNNNVVTDEDSTPKNVNKDNYNPRNPTKGLGEEDDDDFEDLKIAKMDLALRKFITKIADKNITNRIPQITGNTVEQENTTAEKTHPKDKLEVVKGNTVVYTIRVYNEGKVDGYASEVTDYLPEGLTLKENSTINTTYGWTASGKTIKTTYLADKLLTAVNRDYTKFNENNAENKYYRDLQVECIVNDNATSNNLKNIAEITEARDKNGNQEDEDSTPKNVNKNNYNPKNPTKGLGEEDDDDFEDLKIVEFDLALRKYITKVEDKDGNEITISTRTPNIDKSTIPTTATYKHRKDPVVVKPGYFVYYDLTVYNEGDIDGFAKTITDQLPAGVRFVEIVDSANSKYEVEKPDYYYSNGGTHITGDGVLILKRKDSYDSNMISAYNGTTLNSETVTIKCKVIADKETGSDKIYTNIAWISEDYNEKGATDRDSKPVEHPDEDELVTDYPDNGYINEKDNKNKTLSNANEYFKGEQDDDDFEKIIIYKGPVIHKGVKTVKNQDSGYDEDVTTPHEWVINSSLPVNVKDYKKYKIVDDIDYRLVYGEVKSVKIIDKDGNTVTELEEGENKDYTVNYTENTSNNVSQILGNKYSGTLTLTFIDTNKTISDKLKANGGNIIEVKFATTFAKDENGKLLAEIIGKEIPNKAKLEYKNESAEEGNEESEKPEVHTGGITLYKYETKDGKKVALKDAEFKIFRTQADATAKKNAVQTAKSDKNGLVEFVGLEYGEDAMDDENNKQPDGTYDHDSNKTSTKYWIVETKAPKGYKTIEGSFEVTINNDSYKDEIEVLIREEESKETTNRLIENKPLNFDLALRKFITAVNDKATKVSREPVVDVTNLKEGKSTTATYTHPKDPVDVVNSDVVSYSLRIYNEGQIDGYASIVTDDIPDGLEFLPEHNTNKEYRWVMYEELKEGTEVKDEDKDKVVTCKVKADSKEKQYIETTDAKKAVIIRTDYLSKEQGEERMQKDETVTENPNLLKAFDGEKLDYKDLKLVFRVTEPNGSKRTLINYAQISEDQDEDGNDVTDIDSTPDIWNEGEDDQDIEKLIVPNFDLALRKWVTQAIVIENGQETVTNTGHDAWDDPEEIVKVELHRKKLSNVTVKFRYSIRIYNQGELEGYAKEITDYIPEGLKFVAEDNPTWKDEGNNVISTRALENTLLKPGEYADVEVLLTWINGKDNLGLKVNTAEISEDYNEKGVPDCDSVPDNKKPGEDDIDDAPVMLSISTGMEATYIVLGTSILVILAGGIFLIKKYVL